MDAIKVPRPPKFVPMISPEKSSVNPDSSSAAGTLLMILAGDHGYVHFPANDDPLQKFTECGNPPYISYENKKSHKGQKQGIIHPCKRLPVRQKDRYKDEQKNRLPRQYTSHRKQTDQKQYQINCWQIFCLSSWRKLLLYGYRRQALILRTDAALYQAPSR